MNPAVPTIPPRLHSCSFQSHKNSLPTRTTAWHQVAQAKITFSHFESLCQPLSRTLDTARSWILSTFINLSLETVKTRLQNGCCMMLPCHAQGQGMNFIVGLLLLVLQQFWSFCIQYSWRRSYSVSPRIINWSSVAWLFFPSCLSGCLENSLALKELLHMLTPPGGAGVEFLDKSCHPRPKRRSQPKCQRMYAWHAGTHIRWPRFSSSCCFQYHRAFHGRLLHLQETFWMFFSLMECSRGPSFYILAFETPSPTLHLEIWICKDMNESWIHQHRMQMNAMSFAICSLGHLNGFYRRQFPLLKRFALPAFQSHAPVDDIL